jgi:hypothetical protein
VPLGWVNSTLTEVALNNVAVPIIGEPGFVVTEVVALDVIDVPPELVAVTVNVYGVFGVNPETMIGDDVPVPTSPKLLVTV